jgi:hypothetical protein
MYDMLTYYASPPTVNPVKFIYSAKQPATSDTGAYHGV